MKYSYFILMGVVLSGLAQQASSQQATDQQPAQKDAPAVTAEASTAAATAPADAQKAAAPFDLIALQKAGYKIVDNNGEKLFCKREPVLGSRLLYTTRCMTQEQLQRRTNNAQDTISDLSRRAPAPRIGGGG
jgi:hypothetical protein